MHTKAAEELTVSCYHYRCMNVLTSHPTAKHADASKPLFFHRQTVLYWLSHSNVRSTG